MRINNLDSNFCCQNFVKNRKAHFRMTTVLTKIDIGENQQVTFSLSKPYFHDFHLLTSITNCISTLSNSLSKCQIKTNLETLTT